MHRLALALGVIAIVLAATAMVFGPVSVLTVRVLRPASAVMQACRADSGADVRLGYRHSVERTPVEGRFAVSADRTLLALETRFTSTGTGLPNTAASRTRRDGGWLVVDEERRPMASLRFYLLAENQTRLSVDGRSVDLGRFTSGNLLHIGVESAPRWRWWLWTAIGWPWGLTVETPP